VKVVVAGTCQAIPLARCLSVMQPAVRVERLPTGIAFDANATDGDVVFHQRHHLTVWTPQQLGPNEFLYPRIWFNAFHPDLVYVRGPSGAVTPPLGDYHSSLVLYAWHRGMSRAGTARLFSEAVFERARFFSCWDAAKQSLLEEGRAIGFPLDDLFARWERSGAFMHAANHPALRVTADIARDLARRAGLPLLIDTPEYYVGDPMLEKAVWPIYPQIAERRGVSGGYAFKPAQPPGADVTLFGLEEFIARSFEAYACMSPDALACARLEHPAYRDLESIAGAERRLRHASRDAEADAFQLAENEAAMDVVCDEEQIDDAAPRWDEYGLFLTFAQPHQLVEDRPAPAGGSMEALGPSSMRAPLDATLPGSMTAGTVVTVACTVRHDGDVPFATAGKHPVFLCYRWYDARGSLTEVGRSIHTALPASIAPGASAGIAMRIAAPRYEGRYRLRVALLQSEIAWFDDVDPRNGVEAAVAVAASSAASTNAAAGAR
jgi:hypothetical protein